MTWSAIGLWFLKNVVLPFISKWLNKEADAFNDSKDETQNAAKAKEEIKTDKEAVVQAATKEEALDALAKMFANRNRRRGI